MPRIHLNPNTLILWLSLTAAASAASCLAGCGSSDSGGTAATGGASAGKGGKSGVTAGAPASGASGMSDGSDPSEAGDGSVGGKDSGSSGGDDPSGAGVGGKVAAGGAEPAGDAGRPSELGDAGAGGVPESGGDETAAAIQRATTLIGSLTPSARQCPTCHQANYGGLGYWKNLTPDPTTGIGGDAWTDEKIKRAIHDGLNEAGDALCSQMEHYQFTDAQLDDLVVFLRNLQPVVKNITLACPK